MTTHPDKAYDLVERLLGYSSMNDHLSWRSKCEREAAATIKELKVEVERLKHYRADAHRATEQAFADARLRVEAEARAAKAEEALKALGLEKID